MALFVLMAKHHQQSSFVLAKIRMLMMPVLQKLLILLVLGITVFSISEGMAHDTWLLPKNFHVRADSPAKLSMTSGMAFPALDHAIARERVEQAIMRLAGEIIHLTTYTAEKQALNLTVRPANVGVAVLSVVLKPRTLELKPASVREYLHEIGAADSLQQLWKKPPSGLRWRETYIKHAKTFLAVGETRFFEQDSSWRVPQGLRLEIIPERHPGLLKAGDDLPIRVLLDGKPLPNFPLGMVRSPGGAKYSILQKTDENGRVRFRLPKAARYLFRGTLLLPSSNPDVEWESHFSTMTLEVR